MKEKELINTPVAELMDAAAFGNDMEPTPEMLPELPQEETALAERSEDKPAQPGTADSFFGDVATKRMWFNAKTQAEALAVVKAMDDTDFQLQDCVGQVIEVVQIIAHESEFENEKKETVSAIRTVLIDINGKSYGSVANGVRDSVAGLFSMVGLPPYEPAIRMSPIMKKTRAGFRTLKLVPVV